MIEIVADSCWYTNAGIRANNIPQQPPPQGTFHLQTVHFLSLSFSLVVNVRIEGLFSSFDRSRNANVYSLRIFILEQ